jgi:hypothetical protein
MTSFNLMIAGHCFRRGRPPEVALVEKNLKVVPPHIVSPAGRSQIAARIAEGAEFLRELRGDSDDFRSL